MEKKQSNYWTDFRPIWWGEIKSWIGWGSLRQIITDTIIVAGSIILLFVGGEFDLANEEISVRVATMIFGAIWLVVIFVISYVRANQVLYTKQQENQYTQNRMITRLIKKLEGKPKKTTKVKIIPREEFPHVDEDGYYYAYLEVSNGENNDLIDCYANLLTLRHQSQVKGLKDLSRDLG